MTQSFFFRLLITMMLAIAALSGFAQPPGSFIHYSFTDADWDFSTMSYADEKSGNLRTIKLDNGKEMIVKTDPSSGNQEGFEMINDTIWIHMVADKFGKEISREEVKLEDKPFSEVRIPMYNEDGEFISEKKYGVFKFRKMK